MYSPAVAKPLLSAGVLALLSSSPPPEEPPRAEAVAVVSSLTGNAWVSAPPEMKKDTVRLFDWLPAGSLVDVGSGSSLILAFSNGSRFELGEKTKAAVAASGLTAASGTLRPLDSVPPMPRMASIASGNPAGARSGAIRIRGQRIENLYPRADTATLPEGTTLRFSPIDGAARYKVELEDESGRTLFEAETPGATLNVPTGILMPGARYYWKVRSVDRIGPAVRGESEFATLATADMEKRTTLKATLENRGDLESLALLAEVDRRLGLLAEANEEFQAALARSPGSDAIRRALEEIQKQLSSNEDPEE